MVILDLVSCQLIVFAISRQMLINITCVDEILLSSDKTVAIIDGSGVLADPAGLNREELVRLAKARKMISNFDRSKLGKDGYVVLVEDQDVKLPCKCGV